MLSNKIEDVQWIDEEERELIETEMEILKNITHPCVVCYYGCLFKKIIHSSFVPHRSRLDTIENDMKLNQTEAIWIVTDYCELGSIQDLIQQVKQEHEEAKTRTRRSKTRRKGEEQVFNRRRDKVYRTRNFKRIDLLT